MSDEFTMINKVLSSIMTIVTGLTMWAFKRSKEKIDDLNDRMIKIETQAVTDSEVRDIIKSELNDVKHDISEIKNIVTDIRIKQARLD